MYDKNDDLNQKNDQDCGDDCDKDLKTVCENKNLDCSSDNEADTKNFWEDDDSDDHLTYFNLERDEKARFLIERGEIHKFYLSSGNGPYSGILRGLMGDNEQGYLKEMKRISQEYEKISPEIYVHKKIPIRKKGIDQSTKSFNGSEFVESTHITKEQFIELYSAVCFANEYGVALNAHVCIQWSLMGYSDHSEAAKVLQDEFIKHLASWYNFNMDNFDVHLPHELFWIYTHECPPNGGFHTHFLVGIPNEMRNEFRAWVKNRIAKIWNKKCRYDGCIKTMPKEIVKIVCPPSRPIQRQWYYFQYLCKGLDPKATIESHQDSQPIHYLCKGFDPLVIIEIHQDPQLVLLSNFIRFSYCNPGHITCKNQVGLSRNFSRTERKKFGFKSYMENGIFDIRRLYSSHRYDSWHRRNPAPWMLDPTNIVI